MWAGAIPALTQARATPLDLLAILVCTLCWGTTWYAIVLQLGVVDPVVSIAYRFSLAAFLLFAWCGFQRVPLSLTRAQHLAALGMGLFTFAGNYVLVYWAEQHVASAVVAVLFAAMSFVNLVVFFLAFGQRAAALTWFAALLGVAGVAVLSWQELTAADFSAAAASGIGFAIAGVVTAAVGNIFARRAELTGAGVAASTAWAMLYGVLFVSAFIVVTGRQWTFEATPRYIFSLLHLAVSGSVVAFLVFFGLARRRGFALASYVNALTPLVAMVVSSVFEFKTWSLFALSGFSLVLAGQWIMLRAQRI